MRQRDKARIFRRFMRGESVDKLAIRCTPVDMGWSVSVALIESIIREGLDGAFDPLPMKQARAYARAAGVKVAKAVKV